MKKESEHLENRKTKTNWEFGEQWNKHLGSLPSMIIRTIIKLNKSETQKNGPEDKQFNDYT